MMPLLMNYRHVDNQRGMTISELLVSMVLFSVVGAATTAVVIGTFNSMGYQSRMVDAQLDVATAMALLQDDLRAAGYITDNMNEPIFQELVTGTPADSISFVGDVNADNVSERISYAVVGGKLMRAQETWNGVDGWISAPPQPVAAGVRAFTLDFHQVDPCTAVITEQTAAELLASSTTTYISASLTGSGTYKGNVVTTRTLKTDIAVRQENVLPTCS
jgi:prepilin-type N-terminal cleavage/methylation domain-containing protein